MAKENIKKFFDTAMTDNALAEEVAVLAAKNGYDFTAAELLELGETRPLSDTDIEDAAGGSHTLTLDPRGVEKIQPSNRFRDK